MISGFELTYTVATFGLTIWLGSYLLGRNFSNTGLRLAGLGLIIYSLGLGCLILSGGSGSLRGLCQALLVLPALFWTGALIAMLPESQPWRFRLYRLWLVVQLPLALLILAWDSLYAGTGGSSLNSVSILLAGVVLLPLLAVVTGLSREAFSSGARRALGLLIFGGIIFSFSTLFFLFPLQVFPVPALILGMGIDLLVLGLAITRFDALDQGEAFVRDLLRSFTAAFIYSSIFAGLVVVTSAAGPGMSYWVVALLLSVIAVAVVTQTLASPLYSWLDQLVFAGDSKIEKERQALRGFAEAAPRLDTTIKPDQLGESEMARLTRRAISNYGNLPRLSSSPLVQLPLIDRRLEKKGRQASTLERATELKDLLNEAIMQLKPRGEAQFGETDEWRFFNALYYPYIAGLKPYSRRVRPNDLDADSRAALSWFQAQVPERTLHNWQNSAARLVASYITEQGSLLEAPQEK
ncbi:MAG: hypothetical protein R3335_05070 [Anaerolineales bacterium]|nr:hypothetical protein [Anaerolineales bacterium]